MSGVGTLLYAGTDYGLVFRSTNSGNSWVRTDGRGPESQDTGFTFRKVGSLVVSRGYLYAGTFNLGSPPYGAGIFRCAIGDTHWVAVNNGLSHLEITALISVAQDTARATLFAGTGSGIFRSTDDGQNWTISMSTNSANAFLSAPRLEGGTNLFAAGRGVLLTTDNGTTWVEFQNELTNCPVNAITTLRRADSTFLFAGTYSGFGGMFRSSDLGISWTAINTGLPTNASISVLACIDSVVFAGISGYGVYYSLDDGLHWAGTSIQLGCNAPVALAVCDTNLFAGIHLCEPSVWRRPLSEMLTGIHDGDERVPSDLSLEQNFPNPFNPSTKINFALPDRFHVSLIVYDLLGRRVAELIDRLMEPGTHSISWNAIGQSSGVYFMRFTASNPDGISAYTKVRKCVLMK